MDKLTRIAAENGVVIFSRSSCCLGYTVNILFQELGVTPVMYEIDRDLEGREMEKAIINLIGCVTPLLAVFIAGNFIGSTKQIMSLHPTGGLIPLLNPYKPQGFN